MKRHLTMYWLAAALTLLEVVGSIEVSPQGYAEILATNSPEKMEEFIEIVVTQKLHGFVTSDDGLKKFAETAPKTWPELLSQLSGQPWLCGGDTGKLCDDPLTAPLSEQGWASVLRANATARGILTKRIAEQRLHAKVTNEKELLDWARLAPDDWDSALAELKAAKFLCGGETTLKCDGSGSTSSSEGEQLDGLQQSAVRVGWIAFVVLVLIVIIIAVLAGALLVEDMTLWYAMEGEAADAKKRFYASLFATPSQAPATQQPEQPEMRMMAPVQYYQGMPILPLSTAAGSARVVSAGPPSQVVPMLSPMSMARAGNEPWPV